ncbi:hypothetical protein CR194_13925 [Salipaludibacillus keqinensis]|uniref:DUF4127 domain-containing protein n=1 Tax=Salipaludibacillus keqinensis TaxID=2045207 RepID=A0A323TGQ5_9BACI|nr:DUF4127 family protein [Salipaludibacillus keqinensis]PYZ92747.1 hypothetical protein CR194_13925 [Salipaludibacillus keqinensis]
MTSDIALLPVDARPVTRLLPAQLINVAGRSVRLPDKEILGFLKEPGDVAALHEWLRQQVHQVKGFVLSIDMLIYGGLVPSRVSPIDLSEAKKRLNLLKELKLENPDCLIFAYSTTMRLSNSYVNEEEKDYWSEFGKELWKLSFHSHRLEQTGEPDSQRVIEEVTRAIPSHIIKDYTETRKRNFLLNQYLLDEVENEVIDLLVFPQDDTSEYGFNISEQQQLSQLADEKKLFDQVLIYPGADEVASVMATRMVFELAHEPLPSFYPIYSGEKGSLLNAMYEDRPIAESVKGQVHALGASCEDEIKEADIVLAVNVPGKKQGDLALQLDLNGVHTADRNLGEWLHRMDRYINKGKEVAVADVAYANGADPAVIPRLLNKINWKELLSYAGWNTAGNTIGTVVAQSALVYLAKKEKKNFQKKNEEVLVLRMLEDYLYQTVIRKIVRETAPEGEKSVDLEGRVSRIFLERSQEWLMTNDMNQFLISDVHLPWKRTFEIGFLVQQRKDE